MSPCTTPRRMGNDTDIFSRLLCNLFGRSQRVFLSQSEPKLNEKIEIMKSIVLSACRCPHRKAPPDVHVLTRICGLKQIDCTRKNGGPQPSKTSIFQSLILTLISQIRSLKPEYELTETTSPYAEELIHPLIIIRQPVLGL